MPKVHRLKLLLETDIVTGDVSKKVETPIGVMKGLGISERNCYLLINCRIGLSPSK